MYKIFYRYFSEKNLMLFALKLISLKLKLFPLMLKRMFILSYWMVMPLKKLLRGYPSIMTFFMTILMKKASSDSVRMDHTM